MSDFGRRPQRFDRRGVVGGSWRDLLAKLDPRRLRTTYPNLTLFFVATITVVMGYGNLTARRGSTPAKKSHELAPSRSA